MYPNDLTNPTRQITEYDILRPTGFRFSIAKLPQASFFCQAANLPGLQLGAASMPTPLIDLPIPGDKMVFSPFTIRFLVQENLQNYLELYTWMTVLGFPATRAQFAARNPDAARMVDAPKVRRDDLEDYSDARLTVLGSDNNAVIEFHYVDCFPTALSGLDFDSSDTQAGAMTATATFSYRFFIPKVLSEKT